MQLASGYTDFCTHTKLATIGELRRSVMQNDSAIDAGGKVRSRSVVIGHYTVGMVRAISIDMINRGIEAINHPDRENGVQILR